MYPRYTFICGVMLWQSPLPLPPPPLPLTRLHLQIKQPGEARVLEGSSQQGQRLLGELLELGLQLLLGGLPASPRDLTPSLRLDHLPPRSLVAQGKRQEGGLQGF
jgi:hypothetical protein